MAPVIRELKLHGTALDVRVCVTAQHREMLDQVLEFFEITPEYDLDIMKPGQGLHGLTAAVLQEVKPVLDDFQPDLVLVHGDTTTTMATTLSAFYNHVPVGHVEAGLRTYDMQAPFPEEANRVLTGRLATYHFAPTSRAADNLTKEGVDKAVLTVTGNTVIDALLESVTIVNADGYHHPEISNLRDKVPAGKDWVLVTGHRRENFGSGFENICMALRELAQTEEVEIIYPVHLNPNVQGPVYKYLEGISNVHLISPLSYPAFVWLMDKSRLIITDSGGVQEEAPSLGKPVLVMRETTERPEAVEAGTVILVGTDKNKIVDEARSLLQDKMRYERMAKLHNPYGDGKASERIRAFIEHMIRVKNG